MLQRDTYERVGSAPFRVTLARKGILPMSSTFSVADETSHVIRKRPDSTFTIFTVKSPDLR